MRPDRRRHRASRGYTLVEVMVALGILAVGVIGATAGQIAAMKLSSDSKSHAMALSLAEAAGAEIAATPSTSAITRSSTTSWTT